MTWLTAPAAGWFRLLSVACVRKSVCLGMALLLLSIPLAACALPGETMTDAEQDCCLQMSDQCDGAQMSADHTCCTKAPQVEGSTLKATSKYMPAAPEAALQTAISSKLAAVVLVLPSSENISDDSSPPPGSNAILRI